MIYFIDLFAGAGGVTTGLSQAGIKVIGCINHDPSAIKSHSENHPDCLHFIEDIRTIDLHPLLDLVKKIRKKDKKAIIAIWASIECIEFSRAKGGLPKNADSRTLANDLFRYLDAFDPDMLYIENVEEFMSWGPLDENGKPISRKCGLDYQHWVSTVCKYGYNFDYKIMNSADFGAYTARKRYFAQFVKPIYDISWPEPTHTKFVEKTTLFANNLKPWNPVKDVLELNKHGRSIFGRKKKNGDLKNLSDKTYMRIYAGLIKFVAGGKDQFLLKYNSINQSTGKYVPPSIDEPSHTIAGQPRLNIISTEFATKHFITTYHGNGNNISNIDNPSPTVTSKDTISLINTQFIHRDLNNTTGSSIERPSGTVMPSPKLNLVSNIFLMNPQYNSAGSSIEKPSFTLIASMDKAPPYLIITEKGDLAIQIEEGDTEYMIKIKEFMALYGIVDIKMRMLFVKELQQIQGFPSDYIFIGKIEEQKKQIGNAVEVNMAKAIGSATYNANVKKQ